MKPEDLKKAPKLFIENIKIGYSPEYFVLGLSSGSQAHIFSLTPAHAKRLKMYLENEITNFEKVHGEIETQLQGSIVSPIQQSKRDEKE